jgi:asparagine synthase (glutamine-hydrolysing)
MAKLSGTPVRTFSVGFEEQGFNELAHAEEAARICGTDHTSQIVKGDVVELLPRIVRHYGEPFADSSAIPSFLVSETARESVTVVLNGDGGDELLAGYPHYRLSATTAQCGRLADNVLSPAGMASMTAALSGYDGVFPRAVSRGVREFLHPEFAVLMSYRSLWSDASRRALLSDGGFPALLPDWRRRWLEASHAHAKHAVDRMLYFDNHTYLADDLLVKMDIASMHCSLEARSPLLDHVLIEFCAKLPVKLKLRGGSGKYLLKRLASRTFGDAFLARPKKGFSVPLEQWLKGPLRERMRDVLSNSKLMEPFDSRTIAKTVDEFLAGTSRQNRRNRLWVLFMYGLWREMADGAHAPGVQRDLPAGTIVRAAGQ